MPRSPQWSAKRERQYEHIKAAQQERGVDTERAEEIAARTVNKKRAQTGEAREASDLSMTDMAPDRRGGKRSGRPNGPRGRTRDQLYAEARRKNVEGRSSMTKDELRQAVDDS